MTLTIGIVGARGYAGRALLRLVGQHPDLDLMFASSREHCGQPVSSMAAIKTEKVFADLGPEEVAGHGCDIVVLALPDAAATPFVAAIDAKAPKTCVIDLSSDYRFDRQWAYGLPELYRVREEIDTSRRIANPGCYATAMQVALHPMLPQLAGTASCFGVSGFSGAGSKPSSKNDQDLLADNLIPYGLVDHKHEKEVSHHLSHPVRFTPHVHPAFSGLLITAHLPLNNPMSAEDIQQLYYQAYEKEPLITLQTEPPDLRTGTGFAGIILGGITVSQDRRSAVIVAAEDNLLKGAAVQAMQNINIASGFSPLSGIIDR